MKNKNKTVSGTDIDKVKRLNAQSGLTYNEAKVMLAKKRGIKSRYINNRKRAISTRTKLSSLALICHLKIGSASCKYFSV
ncbi:hypothetical protein [Halalkalibacter alkaliphilus]|uniref:Uncharacterized protein n=1 Tax=Halalkalibacter alkaliphilus TaxID=2917993 RepID=A0A9X2CWV5_9BACI|nr:hypothetical protein [Halalkalibacter alkaliphilus]MCL7749733.1 hypothetical protein [Halalkalibacter alkaliphilus]